MRDAARAFAIKAHGDQKYGDAPYATHLDAVVSILEEFGHTDAIVAGYLHDVIEDTAISRAQLEDRFGADVAAAVAFCSDEPGPSRKERKVLTYARMRADIESGAPWVPTAIRSKVADRLANVRASVANNPHLLAVYRGEMDTFRAALYVARVCDEMWSELERLAASPDSE